MKPLGSLHCGYYVCEHLRTCGKYKVNREHVSHYCFMYLFFTIFIAYLLLFVLHQFPNYRLKWDYPFIKDMQNGRVNNVISDMCMFLHHEIFHAEGTFFNKNETLAEFPQLCTYERYVV
jgi:hypothetical protein